MKIYGIERGIKMRSLLEETIKEIDVDGKKICCLFNHLIIEE
jgi:hypothetical protein